MRAGLARKLLASLAPGMIVALVAVLLLGRPPTPFKLAAGQPGGMYATFAGALKDDLATVGITIEVFETAGSVENADLLHTGETVPAGAVPGKTSGFRTVLLPGGRVLVVGGFDQRGEPVASAELWDPATLAFEPIGDLNEARGAAPVVLLRDGRWGAALVGPESHSDTRVSAERGTDAWPPIRP
jgi:Kelch motif